ISLHKTKPGEEFLHRVPSNTKRLCLPAYAMTLEPRIDPTGHIIKKVLYGVGILPRKLLARYAGCNSMRRSFDDDKVLINALCQIVVDLVIAYKIMSFHRGE